MAFIGKLYEVETAAKELSCDDRRRMRLERSAPILEAFERWVDREAKATLPKSPMGEAVTYVTLQRKALRRYLDDGDLAIDNNAAERALRGVAIGRKNWLFAGSDEGGKRAAVLYSLIASCKQCGVEPFAYLKDVIERVSRHPARAVDELMPRLWKPARAEPSAFVEASAGRPPPDSS